MKRIHAFEVMDQPWCPAVIRDGMTDYLEFINRTTDLYGGIAERLKVAIQRSGARQVVDLGSGGGGPWSWLHGQFAGNDPPIQVILTDYHPNRAVVERYQKGGNSGIVYHPQSVDATAVPAELTGFRTMFSSFHHFRPEQAQAILTDAIQRGQGIGIFEATERTIVPMVAMFIAPVIALLVITPFLRPFRFSRLFLTYLLPLIPLATVWDGYVSCWRTYTPEEIRNMVDTIPGSETYTWEIGKESTPGKPRLTYLVGYPVSSIAGNTSPAA